MYSDGYVLVKSDVNVYRPLGAVILHGKQLESAVST